MGLCLLFLLILLIGLIGEFFFAAAEISLVVSDNLMFLDKKEVGGVSGTPYLLKILSDPQVLSQSLLFGSVFSVVLSTVAMFFLAFRLFGESMIPGILLFGVIHLFVISIFGEIIPRAVFFKRPEETAVRIARPLFYFILLLRPLITVSVRFNRMLQGNFCMRRKEENPFVDDEDLEWIRRFARGSETLRMEEVRIIRKIFDFSEIRVREVMTPLEQVVLVGEQTRVSQALRQVVGSGFTRLPVFRGEPVRIVGVLHAFDLLRFRNLDDPVQEYDRKPFFVQEGERIRDLFRELQKRKVMMAVVLNADREACGIVTMEDMLEEIFGEIEDEFDLKDQLFREIGRKEYLVDARIDVNELNRQLHLNIPGDGYRTLSGYILHHLRRIPEEGERFIIGDLMFKIELADPRQIYKLFLRKLRTPGSGPSIFR